MSTIRVTYTAASMDDLADAMEKRADDLSEQASFKRNTLSKTSFLNAQAWAWREAAEMVRATTIDPNLA